MRQFIVAFITLFALERQALGQNAVCLTDELMYRADPDLHTHLEQLAQLAQEHQYQKGGGDPVVPVVVHVVWNTAAENIADAVIQGFVAQMDEDFNLLNANAGTVRPAFTPVMADVGIRFCLAQYDPQGVPTSGITRTYTTDTWFDPNSEPHDMKGAPDGISAWDPTRYLNIWVCDIVGSSGNIVSGYTYLPTGGMAGSWQDGLVIDYSYGVDPGERTPTHEAGHYFGLRHTFDGNSCSLDDGFSDTPNTNSPTWNCNNTNLMKCSQLTQYENYMDYSGCTAMFTTQQANFMNGVLNGVRASLLSSSGCAGWSTVADERTAARSKVYPVPATDALYVQLPAIAKFQLLDASGRIALEGLLRPAAPVDIRALGAGPYWLRITGDDWSEVHRVLVER